MKKTLCVFLLCCVASLGAAAYDFALAVGSGQTLYFSVVNGGVEVTYPNASAMPVNGWQNFDRPVGALRIPSSVLHEGTAYRVVGVGQLAFYGCTALTSVSVGDGALWIGNSAFNGCSHLRSATVPPSVDTIGLQAFANCPLLSDVWMGGAEPPGTSPYAFYQDDLSGSTLHVPRGAAVAYAAAPWSAFGSVADDGPQATLTLSANDPLRGTVEGDGSFGTGTLLTISALPSDGFAFICWSDGDMRNPRPLTLMGDMNLWAMFFAVPRDTLYAEVHDTLTVVTHDTVTVVEHDTVTFVAHDTVRQPLVRLRVVSADEAMGFGVGSAEVPEGTLVEVCALPLEGARFAGWNDGSRENPRRVAATDGQVLTAFFEQSGIDGPATRQWHAHARGRTLSVVGAEGLPIGVYDSEGRLVDGTAAPGALWSATLPAAGLFVVRVGDFGVAKVSVE